MSARDSTSPWRPCWSGARTPTPRWSPITTWRRTARRTRCGRRSRRPSTRRRPMRTSKRRRTTGGRSSCGTAFRQTPDPPVTTWMGSSAPGSRRRSRPPPPTVWSSAGSCSIGPTRTTIPSNGRRMPRRWPSCSGSTTTSRKPRSSSSGRAGCSTGAPTVPRGCGFSSGPRSNSSCGASARRGATSRTVHSTSPGSWTTTKARSWRSTASRWPRPRSARATGAPSSTKRSTPPGPPAPRSRRAGPR